MREPRTDHGHHTGEPPMTQTRAGKQTWQNQELTCRECVYADQDVDTSPCAGCHTRH